MAHRECEEHVKALRRRGVGGPPRLFPVPSQLSKGVVSCRSAAGIGDRAQWGLRDRLDIPSGSLSLLRTQEGVLEDESK